MGVVHRPRVRRKAVQRGGDLPIMRYDTVKTTVAPVVDHRVPSTTVVAPAVQQPRSQAERDYLANYQAQEPVQIDTPASEAAEARTEADELKEEQANEYFNGSAAYREMLEREAHRKTVKDDEDYKQRGRASEAAFEQKEAAEQAKRDEFARKVRLGPTGELLEKYFGDFTDRDREIFNAPINKETNVYTALEQVYGKAWKNYEEQCKLSGKEPTDQGYRLFRVARQREIDHVADGYSGISGFFQGVKDTWGSIGINYAQWVGDIAPILSGATDYIQDELRKAGYEPLPLDPKVQLLVDKVNKGLGAYASELSAGKSGVRMSKEELAKMLAQKGGDYALGIARRELSSFLEGRAQDRADRQGEQVRAERAHNDFVAPYPVADEFDVPAVRFDQGSHDASMSEARLRLARDFPDGHALEATVTQKQNAVIAQLDSLDAAAGRQRTSPVFTVPANTAARNVLYREHSNEPLADVYVGSEAQQQAARGRSGPSRDHYASAASEFRNRQQYRFEYAQDPTNSRLSGAGLRRGHKGARTIYRRSHNGKWGGGSVSGESLMDRVYRQRGLV